jgi:Ca2+-binding EF-hand superfamily protein
MVSAIENKTVRLSLARRGIPIHKRTRNDVPKPSFRELDLGSTGRIILSFEVPVNNGSDKAVERIQALVNLVEGKGFITQRRFTQKSRNPQ